MSSKNQALQAIQHLLENGTEADRCVASRALGVLHDKNAIDKLSQHLQDEDIDVCIDAASALGQIADQRSVEPLLESMQQDPDGEVRTAVIEALGKIDDKRVIPALLSALRKRPENLEWDGNWDPWWDMQLKAVTALGQLRVKEAVPILMEMLADDEYQDLDNELLKALAQIGGTGITALMQHFSHGNSRVRRRVMTALRFSPQKKLGNELTKGIKDKKSEVRVAAIQTLSKLNAKHFLGGLLLLIKKDPDAEVRASAIDAISNISQHPDNIGKVLKDSDLTNDQLIKLLDDENGTIRHMACCILTSIDGLSLTEQHLKKIRSKLKDNDLRVAIATCKLLGRLKDQESIVSLIEILCETTITAELRQQAALALGYIGNNKQLVISVLLENITDQHQIVRFGALNALNELDKQYQESQTTEQSNDDTMEISTPMNVIIAALKGKLVPIAEEQPEEQETNTSIDNNIVDITEIENNAVTSTLDSITHDNVVIALELHESTEQNIENKHEPITQENDPALSEFTDIVEQNNKSGEWLAANKLREKTLNLTDDVRYLAARILAESDRAEAIDSLIEALSDDDAELRGESAHSLAQIATRNPNSTEIMNSFGSLMLQLETGTHEIRLACVRALAALGNKEAMLAIIDGLEDEDAAVRIESIIALSKLLFSKQQSDTGHMTINPVNAEQVIENIISKLNDAASGVRMNAASTLVHILNQDDSLDENFSENIIKAIIASAFKGDGGQARHMAIALREINVDITANAVIPMLTTLNESSERRFAVEILEELFKETKSNQGDSKKERAA